MNIIKLAREADAAHDEVVITPFLERFAALVRAAALEEAAGVCDWEVKRLTAIDENRPAMAAGICAAAIRALKEQT